MKIAAKDVFRTLKKHILVDGFHVVIDLEKSEGSYIVDAITGKRYLDCYTYFASLPVGHNHPALSAPEFRKKLELAAVANPANSDIYTGLLAECVDTFGRIAKPNGFKRMFFVAGGALAVENCLKAAFDWKVKKNFLNGCRTEKGFRIAHLRQAFHGRSGYTLSLTNTDPVKTEYFPKFKWPRIVNPKLSFPVSPEVLERVKERERISLGQLEKAIRDNPDDIAAFIFEPIQGEGGDNHFRPEYIQEVCRLCRDNDILVVSDEVQTGMGMTGRMWGYEHHGIVPDLIAFGKKAQICGVMAGPRLFEVPDNVFVLSGRINSTWGGNLADFVRGAEYLRIIKKEKLVANAAKTGKYFLDELLRLGDGKTITNVRGQGLIIAFDLAGAKERNELRQKLWSNGLASLSCGEKSIRFRPPLNFTREQADEAVDILKRSI